jgi:membrane associated rhomboid family serine protease
VPSAPHIELPAPDPVDEADPASAESYDPGPPPPLPRPAWPVLVGWIGLGYALLTVLAIAVGVDLPRWAAWAGIIGFVGGFGLLLSRLPRQRPPDAGDGAVL